MAQEKPSEKKSWGEANAMDLYKLIQAGWDTERLSRHFNVSLKKVLFKIRLG